MEINSLKDISYRDSSFALVRTNPLITGNIKFTVDSKKSLWLNSIDANDYLADNMFKKFPINVDRSYPANIKTFFTKKNVQIDKIFDVFEQVDPSRISHDFKDQYDFSFYWSGARYLNSVQYSERFSYFAPLYVNNCDIPEYFVIFKVPGALNHNISELDANKKDLYKSTKYMFDMLKDSSIIATYSMKQGTQLGDYLRNKIFNDNLFPSAPLNVNFNESEPTTWYGLDIKSGVYSSAGENLIDYYREEHTMKDFEYYMTCGYKRNGLLYPNIVNFEFLFNDEAATEFEHNRYFGMYINSADIHKFHVDFDKLKTKQLEYGNSPKIYNILDEFTKSPIKISNPNGVICECEMNDTEFPIKDMTEDDIHVNYIKDKNDVLYSFKIEDEANNIKKINFINKDINFENFCSSDNIIKISGNGFVPNTNSRTSICLNFKNTKFGHGDRIIIYHSGGSRIDSIGRYDIIEFFGKQIGGDNDTRCNIGSYYTIIQNYDLIDLDANIPEVNRYNYYSVGVRGITNRNSIILNSLAECINEFPVKSFSVLQNNDSLIFVVNSYYSEDGDIKVKFESVNNSDYEYFGNMSEDGIILSNGATTMNNIVVISNDFEERIRENLEGNKDFLVRCNKGYSKIKNIIHYTGDLDSYLNNDEFISSYDIYANNIGIVLEKYEVPVISGGKFEITSEFKPYVGACSFYNVKDFDFDFYSKKYAKSISLEGNIFVNKGSEKLINGDLYCVIGKIKYNDTNYENLHVFAAEETNFFEADDDSFVIRIGTIDNDGISIRDNINYFIIKGAIYENDIYKDNQILLQEEEDYKIVPSYIFDSSGDFYDFIGFRSILAPNAKYSNEEKSSAKYIYRDKFTRVESLCEYNIYEENNNPEYEYFSKMVGYSCKFGYMGGTDCRGNGYRLNTSIQFGDNNISPSKDDTNRNPVNHTMEWPYLVTMDNSVQKEYTIGKRLIIPKDSGYEINTDFNFTSDLTYTDESTGGIYYKYSDIKYSNITKSCGTFFRGASLKFDECDNSGVIIDNSKKYDGYKFTSAIQINNDVWIDKYGKFSHAPVEFIVKIHNADNNDNTNYILFVLVLNIPGLNLPENLDNPSVYNDYKSILDYYLGDYRISFDDNGVSNVTYDKLYSMTSKKYRIFDYAYSHIQVPFNFDIYTIPNDINSVFKLSNEQPEFSKSLYMPNFVSNSYKNSALCGTIYNGTGTNPTRLGIFSNTSPYGNNIDKIEQSHINVSPYIGKTQYNDASSNRNIKLQNIIELFGGILYYGKILGMFTFAGIRKLLNSNQFVKYDNNIRISSLDFSDIKKKNILYNVEIKDGVVIGYSNKSKDIISDYYVTRMQGQYVPLFSNSMYFGKYGDVTNGRLNTNVEGFGIVKNLGFLKITEEGTNIFDYDDSNIYDLKYPYVGESTVGHEDINIMKSSWDIDFHKLYTSKSEYVEIPGTKRREEDDTFVNNLINLPEIVYITKFDSIEQVPDIENIGHEYQIAYNSNYMETGKVTGKIDITNLIIRKLREMGIDSAFSDIKCDNQENYTISSLDDYINSYIKINILPLYNVSFVKTFYKVNNSVPCFGISNDDYNNIKRYVTVNRDTIINKTKDKFAFDFSYPINRDKNIELIFEIKLTLI